MSQDNMKRQVGEHAANQVRDEKIVGLGTGSTTEFAIRKLGERFQQGEMRFSVVCSSQRSENLAREYGIPVLPLATGNEPDLYIDGADEVCLEMNGVMIKGGGGALLWEKLVAIASRKRIFIVDQSKLVKTPGLAFPLPIEVIPFGWELVLERLKTMGFEPNIRRKDGEFFRTDEGNYILDLISQTGIENPQKAHEEIKSLPGVVETGLFLNLCDRLIVGFPDEIKEFVFEK